MAAVTEREPYYKADKPKINVDNISLPNMQSERVFQETFLYVRRSLLIAPRVTFTIYC